MIVVLLLPILGARTSAEESAQLTLGSRLRVTANERVIGQLVAQDEQSLTLYTKTVRDPVVVPRSTIRRVEKSLARSQKGTGAAAGAVIGALSATVFGLVVGESCSGGHGVDTLCFGQGAVGLASAVVLVPLGTLIGAVAAHGERWQEVPIQRFTVNVMPRRGGGVAASVSLRF